MVPLFLEIAKIANIWSTFRILMHVLSACLFSLEVESKVAYSSLCVSTNTDYIYITYIICFIDILFCIYICKYKVYTSDSAFTYSIYIYICIFSSIHVVYSRSWGMYLSRLIWSSMSSSHPPSSHRCPSFGRGKVVVVIPAWNEIMMYLQSGTSLKLEEPSEPRKKPSYFPLYWLFNRDPYSGLL